MHNLEIRLGNVWRVVDGLPHLLLREEHPTPEKIEHVTTAPIALGIYSESGVTVLVYKIGESAWADVPLHLEPLAHYEHLLVSLEDTVPGVSLTTRTLHLPHEFAEALAALSLRHEAADYTRRLVSVYAHLTTDDFVEQASLTALLS